MCWTAGIRPRRRNGISLGTGGAGSATRVSRWTGARKCCFRILLFSWAGILPCCSAAAGICVSAELRWIPCGTRIDLDGCEDVTVTRTAVNTPNDDAICLKASFAMQEFRPVRNILVEDCRVTGFDAGSAFAGTFERNRQAATDRCPPTGRFKFGTEASCGCDTVTVRRVQFIRSRGICLESCDTADLHDILIENCRMRNVSSSPIFIRLGLRNRFPVTGYTGDETLGGVNRPGTYGPGRQRRAAGQPPAGSSGMGDAPGKGYPLYPTSGYLPSVKRDRRVSVDGGSLLPCRTRRAPAGSTRTTPGERRRGADRILSAKRFDGERTFTAGQNPGNPGEKELPPYANAHGGRPGETTWPGRGTSCCGTWKRRTWIPGIPILIQGLSDSRIRDVPLENIRVEYRGGMTREMAVEQRQLNTVWHFSQFGAPRDAQILPWLVNTFFAKNEGLLPRLDWDPETESWIPDPYNVPELADVYPEPSNYGILPAYGLYARHAEGLRLKDVTFSTQAPDERDAVVLDDIRDAELTGLRCDGHVTTVRSAWRRALRL